MMSSFIRLHVPQSIVQIVNVFNANSLVDFFSVGKKTDSDQALEKQQENRKMFTSVKV